MLIHGFRKLKEGAEPFDGVKVKSVCTAFGRNSNNEKVKYFALMAEKESSLGDEVVALIEFDRLHIDQDSTREEVKVVTWIWSNVCPVRCEGCQP